MCVQIIITNIKCIDVLCNKAQIYHFNLDSIIHGKKIPRISYPCHQKIFLRDSIMFTCSHSCSHAHKIVSLCICHVCVSMCVFNQRVLC